MTLRRDTLQRRALITGGDSGIGRSVAYLFAREGADVAIACLPEERGDVEDIQVAIAQLGRRVFIYELDVADPEQCVKVTEQAFKDLGGLDVLVCSRVRVLCDVRFVLRHRRGVDASRWSDARRVGQGQPKARPCVAPSV